MKIRLVIRTAVCALALVGGTALAQGLQYAWRNPPGTVGSTIAGIGDVDGDGFDDVALGSRFSMAGAAPMLVRSGRTGAVVATIPSSYSTDFVFTPRTSLGDLDQDGRADFVVTGAGWTSTAEYCYVEARSGATSAVIWSLALPAPAQSVHAVARIADLDGDGVDELAAVITLNGLTGEGELRVISGATGLALFSVPPPPGTLGGFGRSAAAAGDLDQDGFGDVLVGDARDFTGRVTVHSGATGAVVLAIAGPPGAATFGDALASIGDISGDGVPDVAIASPYEAIVFGWQSGRVRVYSGSDGALLRTIEGPSNHGLFGESIARFPDQDGDGRDDLLIAAGQRRVGANTYVSAEVRLYSSGTGALLHLGEMGQSSREISVVPDANGDGIDDYVVPFVHQWSTTYVGLSSALALTRLPSPRVESACTAKTTSQGCAPRLHTSGAPSTTIGDDLSIQAWGVTPNSRGLFFWGTNSASVPFAGGTLCIASPLRRWRVTNSSVSVYSNYPCPQATTATLSYTLSKADLAATGVLPGQSLLVQGYFRDAGFPAPNDVGLTGSMSITMWP